VPLLDVLPGDPVASGFDNIERSFGVSDVGEDVDFGDEVDVGVLLVVVLVLLLPPLLLPLPLPPPLLPERFLTSSFGSAFTLYV
jgi:hypothetical protein